MGDDGSLLGNLLAQQGIGGASPAAQTGVFSPTFMQGLVGYKDPYNGTQVNSWGGQALGLLQGLGSAYMGMKQYGLAKEQLQFSKDAFNKNYGAQRQMMNAQLEDRQRARVAANPGAYQSVGDYMTKNGIQ